MKLIEAAKAFKLVEELSYKRTKKVKVARGIYQLREALRPAYDFMKEEDEKIRDAHPELDVRTGVVEIEGGTREDNAKAAQAIDKEFGDLHNMDWDLGDKLPNITICDGDLIDAEITGDMIGQLDGFIEFKESDDVQIDGLEVVPMQ